MPESDSRPASNLPPLSLHIPEPGYRPGDTPDFGDIEIPAVDATPRSGEATKPDAMRELCYGLVRVLDFDGQAKGPWDPKLAPERLRTMLRYMMLTRAFDDRLRTLENVRKAGITVCSGGIIGMGESIDDRCEMLRTLANLEPQPESVPINALVAVKGTPLESMPPVDPLDMVRMIAVARILMPTCRVRLSAGRTALTREAQVLCMYAGANSIFYGDKLLVTGNPDVQADVQLMATLGLKGHQTVNTAAQAC